jgi:hypothetical protein
VSESSSARIGIRRQCHLQDEVGEGLHFGRGQLVGAAEQADEGALNFLKA